jgi:protein-S-isoprenylcysteine O-methyltransferase Ste14
MNRRSQTGVATLLGYLGVNDRPILWAAALIALFEVTIIGFATGEAFLERGLGLAPWLVVTTVWIVWTAWHSWWFPRRRINYLKQDDNAYRRAFAADIYPWVSIGFSQMWRPLLNGDTLDALIGGRLVLRGAAVAIGLTICFAGLGVIISAICTIGIHNAAFLREFVEAETFVPIESGVYRVMTHPLFWSGIVYSCGLAIGVETRSALVIAGLNVLYGVVYGPLESRRLSRIFGSKYERYESRSRGFTAWRRSP